MNLYKKCNAKSDSFLVINATLASDNLSRFRKNLLEIIWKLILTIDDRDEKLQHGFNREAANTSHLKNWINMNILQVKEY